MHKQSGNVAWTNSDDFDGGFSSTDESNDDESTLLEFDRRPEKDEQSTELFDESISSRSASSELDVESVHELDDLDERDEEEETRRTDRRANDLFSSTDELLSDELDLLFSDSTLFELRRSASRSNESKRKIKSRQIITVAHCEMVFRSRSDFDSRRTGSAWTSGSLARREFVRSLEKENAMVDRCSTPKTRKRTSMIENESFVLVGREKTRNLMKIEPESKC